jgi:sporulation protein YlmC with PRC-barrel domain
MRLTAFAIATMLVSASALAQMTPSTPPPSATAPTATTTSPSGLTFYSHQPNEMRASKLIGASVRNDANERIGEINEIILDKDGKVAAVVIGVGGFLGIGEREVALDFKSLRIERDNSAMTESGANVIKVNATKDQLKSAPAWTWNDRSGTSPTRTTPAPGGTTR